MTEPTPFAAPTPSPDDKKQVEAMVADCIEAMERGEPDPAVRICGERPELLTRVQRRLAQLAQRGLIPATDQLPPQAIGPYRIRRELGSGGMGAVYLAEQLEPVRRDVALKVIKLGMDTREVVARFQAERQALARMNHPHIAQVFDAGITADGRPYFVMEYVAGQSLTTFCDKRSFSTEQRVALLATVCRAVQHAHDRGFIHRDLKPSNVLVVEHQGSMMPKVIDFGIAKATAADHGSTQQTRPDQVLGTPEYMSPEQAISGGLDVDIRSDVYSLGAILYELLCGELPFDSQRLRRAPRHELERILLDELPTTPSRRLSLVGEAGVAARGGERSTVLRRVAGELDWITLKALAKQRDQRYPSALAFAEDMERWLRHDPVHAAPPGAIYRLRKFARRHRLALLATSAVFTALVTALVVSMRAAKQAHLAELDATKARDESLAAEAAARRSEQAATSARDDMRAFYDLARDAIGGLVDTADKRLAEVPQAEPVRRQMLAEAIEFYRTMQQRQPTDPNLRIDLLVANERTGVLQRRLGQSVEGLETLQKVVDEAERLLVDLPADRRLLQISITANNSLARALTGNGRGAEAKVALQRALAQVTTARALPKPPELDAVEAGICANLAIESDEDVPAAIAYYQRAIACFANSSARHPENADRQRNWARCLARYAAVLTQCNRLDEAAAELAAAAQRLQALPTATTAKLRETEADVLNQFATTLQRLDRPAEARTAQLRANTLYHELAEEHPDVPAHADNEAGGLHLLANLSSDEGNPAQGLVYVREAIALRERLAAAHPGDHRLRMRYARSIYNESSLLVELWQHHGGNVAPAEAALTKTIEIIDPLFRDHGEDPDIVATFAGAHGSRAAIRTALGRHDEAMQEHLAVRDALQTEVERRPNNVDLIGHLVMVEKNLVQAYYQLADMDEAVLAGERGMELLERGLALDARHRNLLEAAAALVPCLAIAQVASGDREAGLATYLRMCESQTWGADTRERGCLMLAQESDHLPAGERRQAMFQRAVDELRAAIAARGDLAAALQRPAQSTGFSHTSSRLRDFDLRLALGDALDELKRYDEQAACLAEAVAIDESLDSLTNDRARNLFAQRAELALRRGDRSAAVELLEQLLARIGPDGGGYYLAAVLFSQCCATAAAGAEQDHAATRAIECLTAALAKREVTPDAARHENFAPLRGRAAYEALLR